MSGHNDINERMTAIQKCLRQKISRVHMPGICGVGMAGLAFLLKKRGFAVSGCDENPNRIAAWLEKNGITVFAGHSPSHVTKADWIIRSTAVRRDNPEIEAARRKGKPIFLRGEVLAAMSAEGNSICVCGTHGKTTTTAMITQLLKKAGLKPSFCIGGETPSLGGVAGKGTGKPLVLEADESDGTLALYRPSLLVVTNIEFDHAEHFNNFSALKLCFAAVASQTRGKIIYCFDDPQARKLMCGRQNTISYGFSQGTDLRLINFRENSKGLRFDLKFELGRQRRQPFPFPMVGRDSLIPPIFHSDGRTRLSVPTLSNSPSLNFTLPIPGAHNALNAAAACAVGLELGIPLGAIASALAAYQPVARRFEKVVDRKDLLVISDYAHHPTEITALIRSARVLKRKRWLAVFQPHRYTRTKALAKLFPPAFNGIAELILCPVYEASEEKIPGGTSWDLYEHFRRHGEAPRGKPRGMFAEPCEAEDAIHPYGNLLRPKGYAGQEPQGILAKKGETRTVCARALRQAWDYLKTIFKPGDGLLIIGAGDIVQISEWARKELTGSRAIEKKYWIPDPGCAGGFAEASQVGNDKQRPPILSFPRKRESSPPASNGIFRVSLNPLAVGLKHSSIKFNEPLAHKTTLRVGGCADIYIEAGSERDLARIIGWARRKNIPLGMLGAGSNLLISDLGVRGIVIRLKGPAWQNIELDPEVMRSTYLRAFLSASDGRAVSPKPPLFHSDGLPAVLRSALQAGRTGSPALPFGHCQALKFSDTKLGRHIIIAGAGVSLPKLAAWASARGLAGAEFLTGIPGTIGGAVRMNAGAWGRAMKDITAGVKIMDEKGKIRFIDGKRLGFSYRSCAGLENKIVLEAILQLQKGNARVIHKQISRIRERRKWMRGLRSAGSVFKNPPGSAAGRIIERLGLKGKTIGGAKISERHANVIATGSNANASDVIALIEIVRDLVQYKAGVDLKREVECFE